MMNIPLPGQPWEAFEKGVNSGTNMFNAAMNPILAREKNALMEKQLAQEWQQHLRNAAIREMQEERLRQIQPYIMQQYQNRAEEHPLNLKHLEAKLKTEEERAKSLAKGGNQRISAAIQEADAMFDRDDPRWGMYVTNKNRVYIPNEHQAKEDEKLKSSPDYQKIEPYLKEAIDIGHMPPASQNFYRKQMNDELVTIDKAKQVKHAIGQARKIIKDNPDLYKKAINIIADPDATPGRIEKSLIAIMPKEQVAAFAGLGKLYADILTKQAQLNGMSRSVYALRLQQQAKPQVKNPDEVNEQIFKNIIRDVEPQIQREKAIHYALKHNQYLPFTKQYEFEEGEPNQLPNQIGSPTEMGMMKGIDAEGNEHDVHPSNREDFIAEGGRIL